MIVNTAYFNSFYFKQRIIINFDYVSLCTKHARRTKLCNRLWHSTFDIVKCLTVLIQIMSITNPFDGVVSVATQICKQQGVDHRRFRIISFCFVCALYVAGRTRGVHCGLECSSAAVGMPRPLGFSTARTGWHAAHILSRKKESSYWDNTCNWENHHDNSRR